MKSIQINNITIIGRTIAVLICFFTLSRANDDFSYFWKNYVNNFFSGLCEDNNICLNFANTTINRIGDDFISSPFITCLNLTDNYITYLADDAFRKLTNLTILFLSNNDITSDFILNGHENLKILIMDTYKRNDYYKEQRIFGKYQNLEILSLSNNKIRYLVDYRYHSDVIYDLSYDSYDLSSQTLMSRKLDIPFPKLKILDLSKNEIQTSNFVNMLPRHGLNFFDLHDNWVTSLKLYDKGQDVYSLILDSNRIEIITWQSLGLCLIGMKSLKYLSVSNNLINDISLDAFMDTKRLEFLNLSRNAIKTLNQYTFTNLNNLQTLDLSFNKIENIPQFSNELNISTFFLHYNKIHKITPNALIQFPMLKKLFLEGNDIEWIDTKAFAQLSMLEELNLSNNNLTFLSEGWSESLISLKYLNLSENNFILLESLSLSNTIPLTELYLMKNPLKHLNIRYFDNLPQNLTVHLLD